MRTLAIFIFVLFLSANVYAQDKPAVVIEKNPAVFLIVLNAKVAPPEAVSSKVDRENYTIEYFDKDGVLVQRDSLDDNSNLISRKYDKEGKVIARSIIKQDNFLAGFSSLSVEEEAPKP